MKRSHRLVLLGLFLFVVALVFDVHRIFESFQDTDYNPQNIASFDTTLNMNVDKDGNPLDSSGNRVNLQGKAPDVQICASTPLNGNCGTCNNGCQSNECARYADSDSKYRCCPAGTMAYNWQSGRYYCAYGQLSSGSPCRMDGQCGSGNCKGNAYGLRDGTCK